MRTFPMLIMASILLMVGTDCREREKPKRKWDHTDGGIVSLPECREPGHKCQMSCVRRDASLACTRCCLDQSYVCNTGHKADYESCEGSR
jgi:hypothetical protein